MPHIFHSELTDHWYYAGRVKDRGNGTFEVIGKKLDITEEIRAIIAKATEKADALVTELTDHAHELHDPERLGGTETRFCQKCNYKASEREARR